MHIPSTGLLLYKVIPKPIPGRNMLPSYNALHEHSPRFGHTVQGCPHKLCTGYHLPNSSKLISHLCDPRKITCDRLGLSHLDALQFFPKHHFPVLIGILKQVFKSCPHLMYMCLRRHMRNNMVLHRIKQYPLCFDVLLSEGSQGSWISRNGNHRCSSGALNNIP